MTAAPKATSHGLGSAAGAGALTAFTGMSAANAGAAENANAATTDKTTFFIDPAPFRFDRLSADTIRPSLLRTRTRLQSTGTQKHVHRGRFTSLTPSHGKLKTMATAAFLGDSALFCQKEAD